MFSISGSSQNSSFDDSHSNHSTGSSKYRRFFSSPQLSLTSGENMQPPSPLPPVHDRALPLSPHTARLLQLRRRSEPLLGAVSGGLERQRRADAGETDEIAEQRRSCTSQQTSALASRHQSTDLPPHLLDDPNFRIYLAGLDHKPTRSDYISYKIALIGDAIDAKYDTQLNQALDALFTEVLKNTITWDSFSQAAKKLMLQVRKNLQLLFFCQCLWVCVDGRTT